MKGAKSVGIRSGRNADLYSWGRKPPPSCFSLHMKSRRGQRPLGPWARSQRDAPFMNHMNYINTYAGYDLPYCSPGAPPPHKGKKERLIIVPLAVGDPHHRDIQSQCEPSMDCSEFVVWSYYGQNRRCRGCQCCCRCPCCDAVSRSQSPLNDRQ